MIESKSQARRIASQTEAVDVDLLVQELAMAHGHIEHLHGQYESLVGSYHDKQDEIERLQLIVARLQVGERPKGVDSNE